ncbi:MAG: glycosyl hydrolase family 28-related protein [bacterium]
MRIFSTFVLLLMMCMQTAYSGTESINVRDLEAKGDGKNNDGPAIQKALDQAGQAGGGVVFLPAGKYRVEDHLVVPSGVTLQGVWTAPHHQDQTWGTVILAVGHRGEADGPALIQLKPSAAVKGITFYYPEQRLESVVPYPWTIQGEGMHGSVVDVTLVNAYQGIDFGTHRNELHYIRNVFGCCLRKGIYIDGCTDIGRIENVHFNPHYWARAQVPEEERIKNFQLLIDHLNTNLEAFIFGRTDWEYVLNTFAFGFDKCYKFIQTERGACNGNFVGIGADGGRFAVWLEATQPPGLLITNGEFVTFAGDDPIEIVATETFKGVAQFNNCSFWGPTDHCAKIEGNGYISFQQCNFVQWGYKKEGAHALYLDGGRVSVQNCFFQQAREQILIGPRVKSAVITGNQFTGPIVIDNKSESPVEISGNVTVEQ